MHTPDGFLDLKTGLAAAALSVGGLALAVRQARLHLPQQRVPLLGLTAAFVFAAQMVNFPIGGGTSGHLMGGVLSAVLLGPSAAVIVMSCVLIVQCLAFADGGVLALGANVFNMAIVGAAGGYFIYRALARWMPSQRGRLLAVGLSAWASTVMAAVLCAGQLALSHTVVWSRAFPIMAYVHLIIGVFEGIISMMVVFAIHQARPELLEPAPDAPRRAILETAGFGLAIALGLALFVAPLASPLPDGLERVADMLGFAHRQAAPQPAPMADYRLPGVRSAGVATALAAAVGTMTMFVVGWAMARLLIPAQSGAAGSLTASSLPPTAPADKPPVAP